MQFQSIAIKLSSGQTNTSSEILFPLAFAPTVNVEDYFTRKCNLRQCFATITWIEVGWRGSLHHNQVWSGKKCEHVSFAPKGFAQLLLEVAV